MICFFICSHLKYKCPNVCNIVPCPVGRGGFLQVRKGHFKMPDKGKLSDQEKNPYNERWTKTSRSTATGRKRVTVGGAPKAWNSSPPCIINVEETARDAC